jgi:hypothetical protein
VTRRHIRDFRIWSRGTSTNAIFFINVNILVSKNIVRTGVGGVGQQSGKEAWVAGYLTGFTSCST